MKPHTPGHAAAAPRFSPQWLLLLLVLAASLLARPAYSAEPATIFSRQNISLPVERLARGLFLVAGSKMKDARFSEAVVLLIQYDERSVLGLIVNQPTETRLAAVLPNERLLRHREDRLYYGGPVESTNIFLLIHTDTEHDGTLRVLDGIFTSASPAVLQELLKGAYPHRQFRAYAGYVGWLPGQLEREIARGDWHVMPADAEVVFHQNPQAIWPDLISRAVHTWTMNLPPAAKPSALKQSEREGLEEVAAAVRLRE